MLLVRVLSLFRSFSLLNFVQTTTPACIREGGEPSWELQLLLNNPSAVDVGYMTFDPYKRC